MGGLKVKSIVLNSIINFINNAKLKFKIYELIDCAEVNKNTN